MEFKEISVEDIQELLDPSFVSTLPLHQHPQFLLLSAQYLKENEQLLQKIGFEKIQISPYYLWIKKEDHSTVGLIPILQVNSETRSVSLVPSQQLQDSFLPLQEMKDYPLDSLLEEFKKRGYFIKHQLNLTGWDITCSLFSIFTWFPDHERKQIIDEKFKIDFQEVSYEEGKDIFKEFQLKNLEKMKNVPAIFKRSADLFQKFFPKNWRLVLVKRDEKFIGMINFIDYFNRAHFIEVMGDSTFNKFYPKILFYFFRWAKKEKIKRIYPAFFEWCLVPFYLEMVFKNKMNLSPSIKKAVRMKSRNLKEIGL